MTWCILPCTVIVFDNGVAFCNGKRRPIQVTATGQGADNFYIGDTTGVAQNFGNFVPHPVLRSVYVVDRTGIVP